MFALSSTQNYHLFIPSTDMRKSFNGLCGIVQNELNENPTDGSVYIFINKRRDKVKMLHWVGSGYLLYYKRLEKSTYELPKYDEEVQVIDLKYTELIMLIDGICITNIKRKKHYSLTKKI